MSQPQDQAGWQQLQIAPSEIPTEVLEDTLDGLGALSVTYLDAEDAPIYEPPVGDTPLWDNTITIALFAADHDLASTVATLQSIFGGKLSIEMQTVADRDWERAWLDDFQPMQFGQRLWICPQGMAVEQDGACIVTLDPGLAFGTGTHSTTRLCLTWLDGAPIAGRSVLDFGCGSGVLGIAALKLGADFAEGIDIDPQALTATKDNCDKNNVSMPAVLPDEATSREHYDVVLANILSGPLVELCPTICGYMKPQADLLLSGILQEQADRVQQAYEAHLGAGSFIEKRIDEDWVMLHFRAVAGS